MMLSDVRDYIESLGLSEHVYMGKMDSKPDKSIGVYNSKHKQEYKTAIGGPSMKSYGTKRVTVLVHWNKSPRDTEKIATELFDRLVETSGTKVNKKTIKFIQPLVDEPVDVGTDESGIYEMVIEVAVIYERRREEIGNESAEVRGIE